ncbi:methylated-DNA-[protein]-cysteine S-methyltransferase [Prauserella shujinwangii]|uniref:Methylated-DNA-[protein]-cysteine S-methyltransferase n=1 Tax=Prauserella shujinwangii TaxID=1453103 RepID=A0A2T0LM30_9PSEU|nr:methylated-DNA--[protein]-cysteine S-methyltransferase [Prauserella shujinwangii]PRX44134.1 methylated-DNA-[protein]-cysteine S-methyltransferase [Prauserella shujinwangii]
MTAHGFAVFPTAIGHCGIAWHERGIVGCCLPEATADRTRDRLRRHHPGAAELAPPPPVAETIDAVTALLRGERADLSAAVLDLTGVPEFHRRVYEIARTIAPGATLTYGEIAHRLGEPGAARAVGRALGNNPFPPIVPCHRVLAAGGRTGGFSATGGTATKLRMLSIENAHSAEPTLFDL